MQAYLSLCILKLEEVEFLIDELAVRLAEDFFLVLRMNEKKKVGKLNYRPVISSSRVSFHLIDDAPESFFFLIS